MRAEDLRPCDGCGGALIKTGMIQFWVVRMSSALVNPRAVNSLMGLTQMMGGHMGLANIFNPEPELATIVSDHAKTWEEDQLLLCFDCVTGIHVGPERKLLVEMKPPAGKEEA